LGGDRPTNMRAQYVEAKALSEASVGGAYTMFSLYIAFLIND